MKTTLLLATILLLAACDSVIYGRDQYGNINYPPPSQGPDPATTMLLMRGLQVQTYQAPTYQPPPMRQPVNCTSYAVGNTVNTNCY